jgi:two-component system, cell cycle sensor histidine kinase and response regulator CckA
VISEFIEPKGTEAMKILLVDNDPTLLKYLSQQLEKHGHECTTAQDGLGAIDILRNFIPDFIFIDLVMPNIDGLTLCRIIRLLPHLSDVYVTILSAVAAEDWTDIHQMEIQACIAKGPLERTVAHIERILEQPEAMAAACAAGSVIGLEDVRPRHITRELLTTKKHFELILGSMSEGILELNKENRIVFANKAAVTLIGVNEQHLLGSRLADLFPAVEIPRVRDLLDRTAGEGQVGDGPLRINGHQVQIDLLPSEENDASTFVLLNNITAHLKAEADLRETNRFLTDILDSSSSISLVTTDLDRNILFWNKGAEIIFGYGAEEMVGRTKIDILYPGAEEKELADEIQKSIQVDKKGISCEIREKAKDGRILWMKLHLSPRFDDRGEVIGIQGIGEDVTQRRFAEEELRKSEERYRNVVENVNVGILVAQDARPVFVNSAIAEFLGRTVEEFLTAPNPFEFIHPEDRELVFTRHAQRLRGEDAPNRYTFRVIDQAGEIKVVDVTCVRIDWGDKPATLNFFTDVTDQAAAKNALMESEARYRQLYEIAPAGILEIDYRGDRLLSVNDAICEFTGYSREELLSMKGLDILSPESQRQFLKLSLKLLRGEQAPTAIECKARKKNGQEFWIHLNYRNIYEEDRLVGATIVAQDITHLKSMEREKRDLQSQLNQAQKLEAIGTLAGGIAHDFNNLLMAIQGRISLMHLDVNPSDSSYSHLKSIEEYIDSGAGLTKQLLGFARRGKYDVKPTDINDIIEHSSGMFGRTKKEITIYRKLQKRLWPVEVDRSQITQVFLNIYVNAWQAMGGVGNLTIVTKNRQLKGKKVDAHGLKPGRYVEISITDTGVGMSSDIKERIFDPFFTTKDRSRGTGLGLASAYGIIQNHGGAITVSSQEGKGTTFSIFLPAGRKIVEREETPVQKMVPGRGAVLLVDDESIILEVGAEMLTHLGYEVATAKGGREAIEIYREKGKEIDIVILDLIMPEMGGGVVYRRMKEINPDVKVLLSSGYSMSGEAQEIMDLGCNGFIQKPFRLEMLSQIIQQILKKS